MFKNIKFLSVAILVIATMYVGYNYPQVQQSVQDSLGSVTGPDNSFECTSQNGMQVCKTRRSLATATTTACVIKSPTSTSTLIFTGLVLTTGTSTATTWTAATSSTPYATSSPLLPDFELASASLAVFPAATTTTLGNGVYVPGTTMAPNRYVVWGNEGYVPADTSKLNGYCTAEFRVY